VPILGSLGVNARRPGDSLLLAYDLAVSPVTFDFIDALVEAEWHRRDLGLQNIDAVIIPGPLGGFRWEDAMFTDAVPMHLRSGRIDKILVAACELLPAMRYATVLENRSDAQSYLGASSVTFPFGYRLLTPVVHRRRALFDRARDGMPVPQVLQAPKRIHDELNATYTAQLKDRKAVVITIRSYGFMPDRNSTVANWIAFAQALDQTEFVPIFVPDTDSVQSDSVPDFPNAMVDTRAATDLTWRCALYEFAWLNMSVSCGPMELCWFNNACDYAVLQNVNATPQSSFEAISKDGFIVGEDFPWARPSQKWFWCNDNIENINAAFAEMCRILRDADDGPLFDSQASA